jgi:hypothetical protein
MCVALYTKVFVAVTLVFVQNGCGRSGACNLTAGGDSVQISDQLEVKIAIFENLLNLDSPDRGRQVPNVPIVIQCEDNERDVLVDHFLKYGIVVKSPAATVTKEKGVIVDKETGSRLTIYSVADVVVSGASAVAIGRWTESHVGAYLATYELQKVGNRWIIKAITDEVRASRTKQERFKEL